MKTAGAVVVILALIIGVLPQFTDCQSQGKAITLPNGRTIPMKCHWTGQAALATAGPILGLGIMVAVNRRRQTLRALSILGILLGLAVISLPTTLIGVCGNPDMICNMVMRPSLIFAGVLIVAASLGVLVATRGDGAEIAGLQAE